MMRLIILLFLLCAHTANAQSKPSLEGKWKVISLKGDDMYLNFKTDSIALFGEFEGKADKTQVDLLTTPLVQFFGECYFIFGSKGQYESIRNRTSIERGTYLVDKRKKLSYHNCSKKWGNSN